VRILTENAREQVAHACGLALNLGAGRTSAAGLLNIDILPLETTDIVADINLGLKLIPDDSVDYIYSRHALEHIVNFDGLLVEIMRVCTVGATLKIIVPHYSNPFGYSDPTHVRFFGIYSFCYYSKVSYFSLRKSFPCYDERISLEIESIVLRFYKFTWVDRLLMPVLERIVNSSRRFLEFYEYRLSRLLPAHEIEFILKVKK
jgi:ubiquinone/menaquinone biosynthesis C-methylase UbiE